MPKSHKEPFPQDQCFPPVAPVMDIALSMGPWDPGAQREWKGTQGAWPPPKEGA